MNDSRLEGFLARIYVDQKARVKFLADPRGEAVKAGLTAEQVEDVIKIDRDGLELFARSLERKKHSHK
jgi:phosphoribosylformylglycinamidine (FGAM) synthase PurS component